LPFSEESLKNKVYNRFDFLVHTCPNKQIKTY